MTREQLERLHLLACNTWLRHKRNPETRRAMVEIVNAIEGVIGQTERPRGMI